jgi:hypothetical protein
MVVKVTGGRGAVEVIPREAWTGAAFLADRWELTDQRIQTAVGFKPIRDTTEVREALARAIAGTWERLRSRGAASRDG